MDIEMKPIQNLFRTGGVLNDTMYRRSYRALVYTRVMSHSQQ